MPDPIRPWLIEVREQRPGPSSVVIRILPTVHAVTAEGALAQARRQHGHKLTADQWLTIAQPGTRK